MMEESILQGASYKDEMYTVKDLHCLVGKLFNTLHDGCIQLIFQVCTVTSIVVNDIGGPSVSMLS